MNKLLQTFEVWLRFADNEISLSRSVKGSLDESDKWDAMNDGPYKCSCRSGKGNFIDKAGSAFMGRMKGINDV